MAIKYKYTSAKQEGGDDGYCYVVRVNGVAKVNGCTRSEAAYYRKKFENEERTKRGEALIQ